ncbi:MaoC family dehydratase N-terminal domain-containing protein [Goodfellowiella coeruleoviolacea]|uniref:UPF0336 protein LX83_002746 n=1 Tax=Goodfellowiella coeruleoviolacea TaxID=334858 RepID=A0AAE3GCS4_9PSEU|nr:MaoC family dehydratase N-terminal domain-containing protein [Goodfellowiella coeruleoviolacea]MCP2165887.1 Acyl dehydratase [Goodfellowiella coeruleoviolacea]
MALDQSFIGREYPPLTYTVGREKIREFAEAIGDTNPVHHDPAAARAAGYHDVVAPPTFAAIVNLRAMNVITGDPELGLDFSRVVHGDQTFVHHRPIQAGDELVTVAHVDNIMARAGNDFLSVRAEITTADGEPVSTLRATLVARGTAAAAAEQEAGA